ncbi:MAG: amidohydrolase family protein [Actinomycetota bacterium]|nr:amidohydrolase family protein [Actinomycetota bacterium]
MRTTEPDLILRVQVFRETEDEWRPTEFIIDGGVITGVRDIAPETPDPRLMAQPSPARMDMSDCYLTPGLVDCHVHLALNAVDLREAVDGWQDEAVTMTSVAKRLGAYVRAGIVFVRDGGDAAGIGLRARRMVEEEAIIGPGVVACGYALHKKGCYGEFLGPGLGNLDEGVAKLDEAVEYTQHLKICQSGLVSFERFGEVGPAQFTLDEMTFLIEHAHEKGLFVMVHTSGPEAVDIAVRAGADTIEHGYFIATETIELMAERGTVWVPTLAPLANLLARPELLHPGAGLDVIKRTVDDHKLKIARAYDTGARLAVGTDAGAVGVEHGESIYEEIEHLVSAGIPRCEVLRMATEEGRRVLGIEPVNAGGFLNSWQPGHAFQGVFYKKDPLRNALSVADIEATCLPPATDLPLRSG